MSDDTKVDLNTISDGKWLMATIRPRKNIHGGLQCEYRPAGYRDRRKFQLLLNSLVAEEKVDQAIDLEVEMTLERVRSWSAPCSVADVASGKEDLPAQLFKDLHDVVWGLEGAATIRDLQKN